MQSVLIQCGPILHGLCFSPGRFFILVYIKMCRVCSETQNKRTTILSTLWDFHVVKLHRKHVFLRLFIFPYALYGRTVSGSQEGKCSKKMASSVCDEKVGKFHK